MKKDWTQEWLEVFKAGTHTDSQGRSKTWTTEDLDNIAQKYKPEFHEAPAVIGHPKDNAPAFGWVEGVKREGESLKIKFKQIVPEFKEWVDKGLYKKVSVSIHPEYGLRHVGFLGAQPPAIKGLNYSFSEDNEDLIYEFDENSDYKFEIIGDIFQAIREFFIEKFGKDKADTIIRNWNIDSIKQRPIDINKDVPMFNEKENTDLNIKEMLATLKGKKQEIAEFEEAVKNELGAEFIQAKESEFNEKLQEKEAEIAKLKAQTEKIAADTRKSEFTQFAEKLHTDGKLISDNKAVIVEFMEALNEVGEYNFSEGKENAVEKFKKYLESQPKLVEFGEMATKDKAANFSEDPEVTKGREIAKSLES